MDDVDKITDSDFAAYKIMQNRGRYAGYWEARDKPEKEVIVVFYLVTAIHQLEKREWIKRIEPGPKRYEPPDVVGITCEDNSVAFEVTELVEQSAIENQVKRLPIQVKNWNDDELLKRLQSKIDKKGEKRFSKVYESVVLVIHTAERDLRPDKCGPAIAAHRFIQRGQINEAYLIFPSKTPPLFHDREHGKCPYFRLSFE